MKLQKQEGPFCFLYAAAMVFDIPVNELITLIGHNGYKNGEEVNFNLDEIVDAGIALGKPLCAIHRWPKTQLDGKLIEIFDNPEKRFKDYVSKYSGILINATHAVAWDGKKILDPKGFYSEDFDSYDFYLFLAIIKSE